MKALFDLNVVLDLLLDRRPWVEDAKAAVAHVVAGRVQGYVAAASFPTLHYIARRNAGAPAAILSVERCLQLFDIVPVDRNALEQACSMPGSDFEDNVQIAAAKAVGADVIVTRDKAGFAHSPVRAAAPREFDIEAQKAGPAAP